MWVAHGTVNVPVPSSLTRIRNEAFLTSRHKKAMERTVFGFFARGAAAPLPVGLAVSVESVALRF